MGYYRAGFDVVGVDINPQKNYPFEFHQGDALEWIREHGHEFDVIHASPPCQAYSTMTRGLWKNRIDKHPDLIEETRTLLQQTGKPYVIENVTGARDRLISPIMLCGTMFGLQTGGGNQLMRHRYFECPSITMLTPTCQHNTRRVVGVYGHSGGSSMRDGIIMFSVDDWREVMGIDWMTGAELSQAIPPAYTEYIGKRIMDIIRD